MRPAAFFDRDGVINVDHGYIDRIDRFELIKSAPAALRACHEAGMLVFVVTNQSGIARGYFDEQTLQMVHGHMQRLLAEQGVVIDDIRFCPHHVAGIVSRYRKDCRWRKPAPGMILDLIKTWDIDRSRSFLIGDKPSDIVAAEAAGISGHLFQGGDLHALVQAILERQAAFSENSPAS